MTSFKRIRFFECDAIEDASAAQSKQQKGRVNPKPAQEELKSDPNQKTIQDIQILRMVYLDMFFMFLGRDAKNKEDENEYFYLTKNLQVKGDFKIHNKCAYVDKFLNQQKGLKLFISLGTDNLVNQQTGNIDDQALVIKIWDFHSLVNSSYIEAGRKGLTGGTYWQKTLSTQEQVQSMGETPKMIPIMYSGKHYTEQVRAFRVSKDGAIAGIVLKNGEIMIYRLLDTKGDFINEKIAAKPIKVLKIKEQQYLEVIDLFIFKRQDQGGDYNMYLVSTQGVLVYSQIEKKDEAKPIMDDQNLIMSPNCSDCDSRGFLLIDAAQKHKDAQEHFIKKFNMRSSIFSQSVEGNKDLLRFFKDHVVEVKQVKTGQQISIYDFKNSMTLFCNSYNQILTVEVEDDAIYMLTSNQKDQKTLYKLHEMEDNIKIQTLLKKGLYQEAQKIAQSANFPSEIIAEICKEHADNLYEKKSFDEALEQFIKTIGFLNPSYVIQRFIDVSQLPNLIKYLEFLVRTPSSQQQQHNISTLADYNKDYTALLLNCYVKTKQKDKISELIKKFANKTNDTIFDVATAIEVCRQQQETLEQAEELARQSKKWKLLVQIQIENKKDNEAALQIIDKNINNLKEKVECLQLYGPKLLKQKEQLDSFSVIEKKSKRNLAQAVQQIAMDIVSALLEFQKNKKFVSENFKQFHIKPNQKIRIEDLLQIFVDDIEQLKDFLKTIINRYGSGNQTADLEKLATINIYHRLLECYLYMNQANQTNKNYVQITMEQQNIVKEINSLIERYDSKIDKHYVLFLFNIYNYSEGVQGCCERLELKQELLNYYIQKKDKEKVLEVCKRYGNTESAGDLWIQALTFFRDLEDDKLDKTKPSDCEVYMEKALSLIAEQNILSPLLVLEIVQKKPTLKFKVLKKYLLGRLEQQDKVIKKHNKEVEETMSKIGDMKKEIVELKTTAKNFNQKECSNCDKKLTLPTVHFMCGHTYHDFCVESEGKRKCVKCNQQFQEIIDKKEQFAQQTKETEQFFKELNQEKMKFKVIANYFGRGLFTDLDQHLKEQQDK